MNAPSSVTGHSRWTSLVVAGSAAMLTLVLLGLSPLRSPRYWWYAAVGDFIDTWRAIPERQLFLFLIDPDRSRVYTSWLGAVGLANLDELGGVGLSMLVRNLAAGLSVGAVAWVLARRFDRIVPVAVPAALLGAVAMISVPVEPSAATLPFATLAILTAFAALRTPERWWRPAVLPLAVLTVVNLEAAVALGLAAVGLVTAGGLAYRATRTEHRLRVVAGAVLAASALPALLGFAYGIDSGPGALAAVYRPPDSPLTLQVLLPAAIALAALVVVPKTDGRVSGIPAPVAGLIVAVTGGLAIVSPPVVFVAAVAATLVIAGGLGDHLEGGPRLSSPLVPGLALVVLAAVAVVLQPGVPTRAPVITSLYDDVRTDSPHPGVMPADVPLRCAEELRAARTDLRIFHHPEDAGLLLYHLLDPERPRAMLFDDHRDLLDAGIRRRAATLTDAPVARGRFDQWNVNAAVLDRTRYREVVGELREAPGWYDLRPGDERFGCFLAVDRPSDSQSGLD